MMKELRKTIIAFLQERDSWIYTGAVLFISLIQTNEGAVQSWGVYLSYAVSLFLLFAPVLLFTWYRPRLREQLPRRRYQALWAVCFLVYTPLVGSLRINLGLPLLFAGPTEALDLLTGLALLLIELALGAHRFLRQRLPRVEWFRQLSLEKGLLLGLLGLALLHSTIAIASYDTFSQTGMIGAGPVDVRNFLYHFPAWFGISLQLFIAFLVAYFFYFVNHHILVPGLLKDKGVLFYLFGVIGTVVLFYPFLTQLLIWLPLNDLLVLAPSGGSEAVEGINGAVAFMIIAFSLPVILAVEWAKQNHAIVSLEQQRTQTELGLLKQQINPHFFFNTLNNLYALSIRKSDQTPEVVMQLSELMRYVIYRGKEAFVPLDEEVAYVCIY